MHVLQQVIGRVENGWIRVKVGYYHTHVHTTEDFICRLKFINFVFLLCDMVK